ncbi:MAG TPA: DinB family protein [Dehalococcoidia bacterium]|nr:DinB family protein [Dehalococcoidia bacterium]
MNRAEVEAALSKDRLWLLETYGTLSADDLTRGLTASEHDPDVMWSALDHLAHLAGIERAFNAMIRRHLEGHDNPVGLINRPDGQPRSREEIMAAVHKSNEDWVESQRGKSISEMIALGQTVRGETLALLGELSDEQLGEKLPGAPWADGTIGGVLGVNALHSRMHYDWFKGEL